MKRKTVRIFTIIIAVILVIAMIIPILVSAIG